MEGATTWSSCSCCQHLSYGRFLHNLLRTIAITAMTIYKGHRRSRLEIHLDLHLTAHYAPAAKIESAKPRICELRHSAGHQQIYTVVRRTRGMTTWLLTAFSKISWLRSSFLHDTWAEHHGDCKMGCARRKLVTKAVRLEDDLHGFPPRHWPMMEAR